jgi:hypothetical protein
VEIPSDRNAIQKEAKKKLKYKNSKCKNLAILECETLCHATITWATGIVNKWTKIWKHDQESIQ